MRTIAENRETMIRIRSNRFKLEKPSYDSDVKIVEQSTSKELGQKTLYIHSKLFTDSSYKIMLRGDRVSIIVTENIKINRPAYIHHFDLQNLEQQSYEKLHNIGLLLPADNYYVVRYFLVPGKCLLKIVLGNSSPN